MSLEILGNNGDNECQLDALTVQIKVDLRGGNCHPYFISKRLSDDGDLVKCCGKGIVNCAIAASHNCIL